MSKKEVILIKVSLENTNHRIVNWVVDFTDKQNKESIKALKRFFKNNSEAKITFEKVFNK